MVAKPGDGGQGQALQDGEQGEEDEHEARALDPGTQVADHQHRRFKVEKITLLCRMRMNVHN